MPKHDPDSLTASERRLVAHQLARNAGVLGGVQAQRLARLMAEGVRLGDAVGRAHVGSVAYGRRLMARALVSAGAAQPRPPRRPRRAPARGGRRNAPATSAPPGGEDAPPGGGGGEGSDPARPSY